MNCPVCGAVNKAGQKGCSCGFFTELVVEKGEVDSMTIHRIEEEKLKCSRQIAAGLGLVLVGFILAAVMFFLPGLEESNRGLYASIGFFVVINGIYEVFKGHTKIQKIITKVAGKRQTR